MGNDLKLVLFLISMRLIDIHCHIDIYGNRTGRIEEIVKRAKERGVEIIVNNGINIKTNRDTLRLSEKYKEIKAALGVYPIDALMMSGKEIDAEIRFIEKNKGKIVMIGETGIDLKESDNLEKQAINLEKLIKLAMKLNKPIAIHSRNAERECIDVLERLKAEKVIMHCFSGNMTLAKKIIDHGWFLSIPSSVKYNKHFQKIIEIVHLKNLFF